MTFIIVLMFVVLISYMVTAAILPGQITLLQGENYTISIRSPLFLQAFSKSGMLKINGVLSGTAFEKPYSLMCTDLGEAQLDFKMLGIIPVKTVEVRSIVNQQVIACGYPIGIKLKTSGVMIINISDVILDDGSRTSPGHQAGLAAGDTITMAGGKNINSIKDLLEVIENSQGQSIMVTYKRNNVSHQTQVSPIKSAEDTKYRIGIWVRDSSAGIGTLTFIEPKLKVYGALGHGINDIDTGSLLVVGSGQLLRSDIKGIKKGVKGVPGELEGNFLENPNPIGDIELNCEFGVFGRMAGPVRAENGARLLSIGPHSAVHTGKASILSCINGETAEEFEIEIQRIAKWDLGSTKNMVIRITDPRLLNSTGGIVQGMSGSPIIQDGRLIGAVTHVFINDPERGYGVFIESMLDKANSLGQSQFLSLPDASGL